ncbi:MAG: hypothetical protein GYB31_15520 [Bacteroidetes bacterium]|nr:hypothetical protein [Bacteroidota bacterium]
MRTYILLLPALLLCNLAIGQSAAHTSSLVLSLPVDGKNATEIPYPTRNLATEVPFPEGEKSYLTAGIFPQSPQVGKQFWLEYGLNETSTVFVELLDTNGFSYLLCQGHREAGVPVEALYIPQHLKTGSYFLKVRAGNQLAVIPITVE